MRRKRKSKVTKKDLGEANIVSASEAIKWPEGTGILGTPQTPGTLGTPQTPEVLVIEDAPDAENAPGTLEASPVTPHTPRALYIPAPTPVADAAPYAQSAKAKAERRRTVVDIRKMKGVEKIACLTSYDFPTAAIVDESGIDAVLVGDSLGNVVLGHEDTLAVTMNDMIHHTRAVARALSRALLVGDLPFMSYQVSERQALRNAGRLIAEGGAQCVKLEGGSSMVRTVRRMIDAGIPVMGHIGLTPQSVHAMGGYRMQGKTDEDRNRILDDALALQDAGVFSIVLECVEPEFTARVTRTLAIPTIGIGSGEACDGQILVVHDMLGFTVRSVPKFVKRRADLRATMGEAIRSYVKDVKGGE